MGNGQTGWVREISRTGAQRDGCASVDFTDDAIGTDDHGGARVNVLSESVSPYSRGSASVDLFNVRSITCGDGSTRIDIIYGSIGTDHHGRLRSEMAANIGAVCYMGLRCYIYPSS
jgi:hypothetical protein